MVEDPPLICNQAWCFVDATCNMTDLKNSTFFDGYYWSKETCLAAPADCRDER